MEVGYTLTLRRNFYMQVAEIEMNFDQGNGESWVERGTEVSGKPAS